MVNLLLSGTEITKRQKDVGYSDDEIFNYLSADMSRLHPDNRPGGSAGLYEEIQRGGVDLSKAVNIVR